MELAGMRRGTGRSRSGAFKTRKMPRRTVPTATMAAMEPMRRMKRALLKSLAAAPEAEAYSPAEGRAAGLDFDGAQVSVLWNRGGSGLVYDFHEIEGGEIIVDGHVVARVRRGEARKSLDILAPDAEQVTLRLLFADARHPEFELALWDATLPVQTALRARPCAWAVAGCRIWKPC